MKGFTEKDLEGLGLSKNPDGTWSRKKTIAQPRDEANLIAKARRMSGSSIAISMLHKELFEKDKIEDLLPNETRKLSLVLMGEPMPKQSVRSTKTGHHYQPQKYIDREKDYRKQIANQLPPGFQMFTQEVRITKLHFLYAPLKKFQKIKGRMEAIRNGELIPKLTAGDIDNLQKLTNDSMSGLVFKDDALIYSYNNMGKYYSTGGCIVIELEGK